MIKLELVFQIISFEYTNSTKELHAGYELWFA
jgi:hypothetical protein